MILCSICSFQFNKLGIPALLGLIVKSILKHEVYFELARVPQVVLVHRTEVKRRQPLRGLSPFPLSYRPILSTLAFGDHAKADSSLSQGLPP